jgi:hypothetical protein
VVRVRTEFTAGEYVLRLTRDELVLLISALTSAHDLIPSDEAFRVRLGRDRAQVLAFASEIADFCRSVPYQGPR